VGQTVQLVLGVTGASTLSYQWRAGLTNNGTYTNLVDAGNVSGSITSTLTISSATVGNTADYLAVITNSFGSVTSSVARLIVTQAPPAIVTQPVSQSLYTGQTAQLSVIASGTAPLSFQWRAGATGSGVYTNLTDGGQISGSSTANLTISNLTLGNNADYVVLVTNALGSTTSSVATLTVTLAPDTSTNALESTLLRLEVVSYPFAFRVLEKSTGTVLLQQTANQFTLGSTYTVSSATNFALTSTTLDADLILSGTSSTAHITFNFLQPGILQTTLSGSNNPPSNIFQQFADQGEDMFGALEVPFGATLSARGYSWQLKGGNGVSGIDQGCGAHAPFYLTTRRYGIYVESPANGTMTFAQSSHTSFSFPVSQLTYDIIYGTDYATIMAGFNSRTVPSYMPPTWAFDSIWWKDDDHSSFPSGVTNAQGNVLDTAIRLTNYQVHASSEWIDRPYGTSCGQGDGGWGNMDFDSSFPNPPQMVSTLNSMGYNLMLWISDLCWCGLYNQALANGWLFYTNNNSTVSLQNTNAYYWFQTNLNVFVNLGVNGYKIDRGDQGEMPDAVQNVNDTLFEQLSYNGLVASFPGNWFIFSRSASDLGRQYTAIWNGDTYCTFAGLQYSVIAGLRAGIINFPMWGSDTGGYIGKPTEELFDRWLEFSAYSPMMEVLHGGGRTPWYNYSTNFTSPTNVVAIAAAQAGTHHDLIPYTRSWLYQATQTGMPVMRPLFFGYPGDTNETAAVTNCEYLFGPSLLVAPVITSNAVTRSVYLLADQWLDYNSKSNLYTGPANITAPSPIQMIPVFVNQGAIIPRGDLWQGNNNWTANWAPYLRIEFFPSESSGSSFPYYTGSSVQTITATNHNHTLTLRFGNLGYSGNLQVYLESLGSVPGTVVSNGTALVAGTGYAYNTTSHLLQVPFNGPTTLVVSNAGSLFSPLEAWRVANFGNPSDPAVSGDGANPSGDGVPNFLKYAFGLNPLIASTSGKPFETIVTNSGTNYLALTFQRATNATDCTFVVQVTDDLLNPWQTGSIYSGATVIPNTTNTTEVSRVLSNNVELITVRDNLPMSAASRRFMRVRVNSP
jgi:alpha-glucosidase (family GH31 glycosyl hydrolase)